MSLARLNPPILCLLATWGIATLAFGQTQEPMESPRAAYNRAVQLYNSNRLMQAQTVLAELLDAHPEYFQAYRLYWRTVGKHEDATEVNRIVQAGFDVLQAIERDRRTESFYYAIMAACERLGGQERAEPWRLEAIERLPRGKIAQQDMLSRARAEQDDHRACKLLQDYIHAFPENVSWSGMAAEQIFQRMVEHSDAFTLERILESAEQFDEWTVASVATYGNPARRVMGLYDIAHALLPFAPTQAVEFAERGCEFVAETAPTTEEFDASAAVMMRQLQLLAHVELQDWNSALAAASAVFDAAGPTREVHAGFGASYAEADLRGAHSRALFAVGQIAEAHEQLAYAAELDASWSSKREKRLQDHPISNAEETRLSLQLASFREARSETRKRRLLAKLQKRPAPEFALVDLEGEELSLASLRGKTVILSFWATWCGPCLLELEEMKKVHEDYKADPDVAILAVSTDTEKAIVPAFVEKRAYPFRVLYTDGKVEENYGTRAIPQLFVIDRNGDIRFHQTGFQSRHFHEKMKWMIETVK